MCCYATKSVQNLDCDSPSNEFSSCDDMLKSVFIKVCIWVEGVFAIFGNLAVIAWWMYVYKRRRRSKRKTNSVQSLLFCHLAFADFLMGLYLLIIGSYDELWKGEYFLHDVEWRAGAGCKVAGAIATLSSEVSVMILVAITGDRINIIMFQFSGKRTSLKRVHVLCLFIWIIGFVMSFTPLLVPSYFIDKEGFGFYGRSTGCLPLQMTTERPAGWEYSVAVFIAFNGAAFLFILVGYVAIFIKVRKSARNVRSSSSSESAVGKRVMFVVMTDFFCWMPIVVLGLISLFRNFNDPSLYIWVIAVFVLPLNSAINPILYTFSSSQTVKNIKSIRKRLFEDKGTEDKILAKRRSPRQRGLAETAFTHQNNDPKTAENEAKVDEPGTLPEEEILMNEPQLVVVAGDDKGKKTITQMIIINKTVP